MCLTLLRSEHNHVVDTNRRDFYTECVLIVVSIAVEIMRNELLRMLYFNRDDGPDEITEATCMGPCRKLKVNTLILLLDRGDALLDAMLEEYLF